MVLSFKYKTVKRPDGTESRTPSVPISLLGKESFDTIALVDSGADISAVPEDVAELLGLDLSGERSPAFGIGGRVNSVETTISIILQKGHEKYTLRIPIKVILGDYDFPMLLGRAGFFDQFIICFDESKEKISLKKTSAEQYYET